MTDEIVRQPVRLARPDKPTVVTAGSAWVPPSKRHARTYNGTRLNANNERVPFVTKPEPPVVLKPRVTEHREKVHVLKSGETLRACSHFDCTWGSPTKAGYKRKHSTGLEVVIPEVEPSEDGEGVQEASEASQADIAELDLSPKPVPLLEDVDDPEEGTEDSDQEGEEETNGE
jgi:hypothetical protein